MTHKTFHIFISSTFLDLAAERRCVCEAVHELNIPLKSLGVSLVAIDMRRGAFPDPPVETCLEQVRRSDLLLTILAGRYGHITENGKSVTEREYDEALSHGIPRLAYLKNPETILIAQHIDTDANAVALMTAFKKQIDRQLTRDTFASSEELRGHVLRDLVRWILDRKPDELTPELIADAGFSEIKAYLGAMENGDVSRAISIIRSRKFDLDMQRFGMRVVQQQLLRDLLEIGSLSKPNLVTDSMQRSGLLLDYVEHFGDTPSGRVALEELSSLEVAIDQPEFSFHVARIWAQVLIQASESKQARPYLRKVRRCALQTGDLHIIAQSRRVMGIYYRSMKKHRRALKWFRRGITDLCGMQDICPFCLCGAFIDAGYEYSTLRQCRLATDRFGKALMIARVIPDRSRQILALLALAEHFEHHGDLRTAVAAYAWMATLQRESDPTDEHGDLGVVLGRPMLRHGRHKILVLLEQVQDQPDDVVLETLEPFNLRSFTDKLDLEPNPSGDHW